VTYHGHPLYRFFLDKKAGQTKGQGLNFYGGKWYVVNANGVAVTKKPASTAGTTTYGGGYGGGGGYGRNRAAPGNLGSLDELPALFQ
jgi:hypothetical protein